MIEVYTNTIDYYYCTVVHTNSNKVVHVKSIIIVHKIVAVIAVYTNTIDYNYCTVVHTNSNKVVHANSTIIVHKIVAVIAVYTNSTDYYYCTVVHTNSTKVVHTNTDSTKVVHMNITKVLHMNSVHGKVVTHSGEAINSTCVSGAPCTCLNSRSSNDSWSGKRRPEQLLILFILGCSSDSWKARTPTPTIL